MDLLQLLTPDQSSRLHHIREYVTDLWGSGDPLHPFYTLHGPQHCRQVESVIMDLFGPIRAPTKRVASFRPLAPDQAFYLLAAAWLHDTGMIDPPRPDELYKASQENIPIADWIRRSHHERSQRYTIENAAALRLDRDEAAIIGTVCFGHRKEPLTKPPFVSSGPDIQLLGATLRVADELDITASRCPDQLMRIFWRDMDTVGRWHWLKHSCIRRAKPHYYWDEADRLWLTYELTILLPSSVFLDTLLRRVLSPIRRVLDDEQVNLILQGRKLGVLLTGFRACEFFDNPAYDDGTTLDDRLRTCIDPEPATFASAVQCEALRDRLPRPAWEMLTNQYRLIRSLIGNAHSQLTTAINRLLTQFLGLPQHIDLATLDVARSQFENSVRELAAASPEPIGGFLTGETLQTELLRLADLTYRLISIHLGDDATRLKHFTHLAISRGHEVDNLSAWLLTNDKSAEVRTYAAKRIARTSSPAHFEAVLAASRDEDEGVRAAAARALGRLPAPTALTRLVEIIGNDIAETVRRSAFAAVREITVKRDAPPRTLDNRKILIVDNDQLWISPLVDALIERGAQVKVANDGDALRKTLISWQPSVAVCELLLDERPEIPVDWNTTPGTVLALLVRQLLGPRVLVIATSIVDPNEITPQLLALRACYVRKPTPPDAVVRVMESLIT